MSELELEAIKRQVENESQSDIYREQIEIVTIEPVGNVDDIVEEELGDVRDSLSSTVGCLDEDNRLIVKRLKEILAERKTCQGIIFKKVGRKLLKVQAERVNEALKYLESKSITETNNLIVAASVWVAEQLGLKKVEHRKKYEPFWKRRIEGDIRRLRQEVNIMERELKEGLGGGKKRKLLGLQEKHSVRRKGLKTVIEELKQRMLAKSAKVRRFEQRIEQCRQNRLFSVDQKRIYSEFNGGRGRSSDDPNAEESKRFWGNIWSIKKEHNQEAEWLKDLKTGLENENQYQERVIISVEKVRDQCRKMPNWKAPGKDGVQGYWLKNLTNLHSRIAGQMNSILMGENSLPAWMTHGRTVLCQKDPKKGNAAENYRPITCLPLMWKLLTGMIAEETYKYLDHRKLLPDKQKGCRRGSRGTKDHLLIDKTVLKDCRRRHTNLSMAWIDYKTAYDLVPHSWIIECMKMFGIAENVTNLLGKSMEQWKLSLTSNGKDLGEVDVKRGIFQGDSLSPLLFVLCMIPLSLVLRKVNVCYEWGKKRYKLNHLLFMDDLKLFSKSEEQTETLVRTVHIFSTDIGMEFGLKKCGILVMKRGKVVRCEGITLPNGEIMKEVEKQGYTYLGIIELDKIKEKEMKEKTIKEYKRRLRLVLKSKLNGKNKITAINTWAVAIFRYGAGILYWKESELKEIDRKSRKTMTMYGALHLKSDVDRLYIKRKEGGRGLISVERCVSDEGNSFGFYVANSEDNLIKGVAAAGTINTEDAILSRELKKQKEKELRKNWNEERLHEQFVREMPEKVDKDKTWQWLSRCDSKIGTEALLCAAQEQAVRTNYVKLRVDRTSESPLCRLCGTKSESVQHLVSGCEKLAQKEYKRRHDNVAKKVHWDLCKKNGLECTEKNGMNMSRKEQWKMKK